MATFNYVFRFSRALNQDFGNIYAYMEWRYTTHRPLGMEEATKKLKQGETSTALNSPAEADIVRTDTVRVGSVTRVEGDLSWGRMTEGKIDNWRYWGVYDGHSGWATSSILRNHLHKYVGRKLDQLSAEDLDDYGAIEAAIKSAFTELDDEIVSDGLAAIYEPIPQAEAMCRIAPSSSGSCVLLALYNPERSTLHVAGAGDSRAVLCRQKQDENGDWVSIPLSVDHSSTNPDERARIKAEHPGEDRLFSAIGRFLGSEVTRSFGDNRQKWPREALEDWKNGFFGRVYNSNIQTPPYSTALPDVRNIQVQPGDVLILGTDGFWNHVSNEDAVYCVQLWIEAQAKDRANNLEQAENVDLAEVISTPEKDPERNMYPYNWEMEREAFIAEHDNIATHLVQNAFGGKERDLFCSVMSLLPPDSKEARDDVTVIVVLF
ncbi:hypothetical protein N7466_006456 [Penicillium verhagenii]|uniref:uncharacterized protein n=1 Tax=Penicillium verhagenii TaxID=1562060 RepID=UPI0025459556|nr:uncharacterized protein N7466_006456 [Penicillium verhagenii]KAJ5930963.1 hypothetical protein N7466_006456 [Penicillium verhagenii]